MEDIITILIILVSVYVFLFKFLKLILTIDEYNQIIVKQVNLLAEANVMGKKSSAGFEFEDEDDWTQSLFASNAQDIYLTNMVIIRAFERKLSIRFYLASRRLINFMSRKFLFHQKKST